ncbi:MAG: response regulator [Betaproteobacteria bacterium]
MSQLLRLLGYDAIAAYDGRQAVAACRAACARLAILDVQMPIMSGVEAARALRADGDPSLMLVSLTGLRGRDLPTGAEWDAFDAHLAKPLQMSELSVLLAEHLDPPPGPSSPP